MFSSSIIHILLPLVSPQMIKMSSKWHHSSHPFLSLPPNSFHSLKIDMYLLHGIPRDFEIPIIRNDGVQ